VDPLERRDRRRAAPATRVAARYSGAVHLDPGWRSAASDRAALTFAALLGLIALGGFVRFLGIDFGRPFAYHPDENIIVGAAMDMVHDRDWNPHDFFYSSFLFDVQAVVTAIVRQTGGAPLERGQGWLFGSEALPEQFRYFLAGRAVVAAMGVLTIPVTFLIALRWGGRAAALIAAAIVALAPLHITNSRYVTTDVPVTLFCALTLLAAVEAQRRGGDRWWILAGALAGLAISTKWNGAVVLVVPLVAYLSTAAGGRDIGRLLRRRTPYLILVAAGVALITTTPAVLLDVGGVTDFLAVQAQLYARGRGNEQSPGVVFNTRALIDGIGPIAAILGSVGCLAIVAGRHRRELALPVFVVLYFVAISIPATHYERNLLPIVPYLGVAAGLLVVRSIARLGGLRPLWRRVSNGALVAGLFLVVLVAGLAPGAVSAYEDGRRLERPDTRTLALDWILSHVPRNTVVARERYTPQLTSARYRLRNHEFLWERGWTWYQTQGVRYLVTSSTIYGQFYGNPRDAVHDLFYRQLFELPEVFRVDPGPETPGPTIRIFELPMQLPFTK
jgi:4-amino-4-deoxy-L-arabinose transferase-like glycosyltransferase